jgi:hypothetical protein
MARFFGRKINFHKMFIDGILFEKGDLDKVFEWCVENRELAPLRVCYMMPIHGEENKLHPFSQRMLDQFGGLPGFMQEFQANLESYSWSGSVVPLLKLREKILTPLKNHRTEAVRKWVNTYLQSLKEQIRVEKNSDIERFY